MMKVPGGRIYWAYRVLLPEEAFDSRIIVLKKMLKGLDVLVESFWHFLRYFHKFLSKCLDEFIYNDRFIIKPHRVTILVSSGYDTCLICYRDLNRDLSIQISSVDDSIVSFPDLTYSLLIFILDIYTRNNILFIFYLS